MLRNYFSFMMSLIAMIFMFCSTANANEDGPLFGFKFKSKFGVTMASKNFPAAYKLKFVDGWRVYINNNKRLSCIYSVEDDVSLFAKEGVDLLVHLHCPGSNKTLLLENGYKTLRTLTNQSFEIYDD